MADLITRGYLRLAIRIEGDRIYMSRFWVEKGGRKHRKNICGLKIEGGWWVLINQPVGTGRAVLSAKGKAEFITSVGVLGWLAQTVSRHSNAPTPRVHQML